MFATFLLIKADSLLYPTRSSYYSQNHVIFWSGRAITGHSSNSEITKFEVAADQGREILDSSRGRSGRRRTRRPEGGAGRRGGENFNHPTVARIKRLIVKATCARESAG